MNGRPPVLEARGLRVPRAGNNVLDIPELKIYAGEILCLIGPNGAGKTTLLHALNKLIKATAGEIILDGFDDGPRRPPHLYRRNFAMVFQEPLLFSGTVFENVASGLEDTGPEPRRGQRGRRRADGPLRHFAFEKQACPHAFRRRGTAGEPGARLRDGPARAAS